jgi:hypothetical protein
VLAQLGEQPRAGIVQIGRDPVMLEAGAADTDRVIRRILVLASMSCCALILASFAMFARDQLAGASQHQVQEIATSATATGPLRIVQTRHGQPRRFIDDAANTLTSPFKSIVASDSQWVEHLVPTAIALLVFGGGLGYLARFTDGMRT